jgi:hypothetical protein
MKWGKRKREKMEKGRQNLFSKERRKMKSKRIKCTKNWVEIKGQKE